MKISILNGLDKYMSNITVEEIHVYTECCNNTISIEYRLYSNSSTVAVKRTISNEYTLLSIGSVNRYTNLRVVKIVCTTNTTLDVRRLYKSTDHRPIQVTVFAENILC